MKILLHTCCAPCTTHCIEVLKKMGHDPFLFFSNANIYPMEEFNKRLREVVRLAEIADVPMIVDEPDHEEWLRIVAAGREHEPEKGSRCACCFRYSLQKAYEQMLAHELDAFTTTLSISPHKSFALLARIGREISPEHFIDINFKKKEGFKRSLQLSKELKLYRQNYCGCEFSMRRSGKS